MLSIKNLKASIEDGTQILKGINLEVKPGEVHAIMGPNGSGKSTLSKVIAGHPAYRVDGGSVELDGKNLLEMEINERALRFEDDWSRMTASRMTSLPTFYNPQTSKRSDLEGQSPTSSL